MSPRLRLRRINHPEKTETAEKPCKIDGLYIARKRDLGLGFGLDLDFNLNLNWDLNLDLDMYLNLHSNRQSKSLISQSTSTVFLVGTFPNRPGTRLTVAKAPNIANNARAPNIPPNHAYYPNISHLHHCLAPIYELLTPVTISWPGTCTFIPHRPVTKFIGLFHISHVS